MALYFPTVPIAVARHPEMLPDDAPVRPLVLVVGDHPLLTYTMAEILFAKGLAVLTASSAVAALEIAHLVPPQILVSDVAPPSIDGLSLAMELTRRDPACEVILLAEAIAAGEMTQKLHRSQPPFLILIKPVHPADLVKQVLACLDAGNGAAEPSKDPEIANTV